MPDRSVRKAPATGQSPYCSVAGAPELRGAGRDEGRAGNGIILNLLAFIRPEHNHGR
jgi:hypothetical protein